MLEYVELNAIIDELQISFIFKADETITEKNCEFIDSYSMNGDIIIDMGNLQKFNYSRDSTKPRILKKPRNETNSSKL